MYALLCADVAAVDAATRAWRGKGDTTAREALDAYLGGPLDARQAQVEANWNPWMFEPGDEPQEG